MNFIGRMEGGEIQVELKYCERCGGLWLRQQGKGGVYCGSCSVLLAAMPNPGEAPPRKPRRRKASAQSTDGQRENVRKPSRIDCLQGVAGMEVWA
jgi:Zn-finger nucleic acid-binding protein